MKSIRLILATLIATLIPACSIIPPDEIPVSGVANVLETDSQPIFTSTANPSSTPGPTATVTPFPVGQTITIQNIGNLEQIAHFGKGILENIEFSPIEPILAIASSIGIELYDFESQEQILFFDQHNDYVLTATWSPDGTMLASGDDKGRVIIWEKYTGKILKEFFVSGTADYIDWSPDKIQIAVANDRDLIVKIFDIESRIVVHTFEGIGRQINRIEWSPSGNWFAIDYFGEIHIYDATTWTEISILEGMYESPFAWLLPDDKIVFSERAGPWDGNIRAISIPAEIENLPIISIENRKIHSLAVSNKNKISIGTADKNNNNNSIYLYDLSSGKFIRRLIGHDDYYVLQTAWASNGIHMASSSDDGTVRIWDTESSSTIAVLDGYNFRSYVLDWSPRSLVLIQFRGYLASEIAFWEPIIDEVRSIPINVFGGNISFSPDGDEITTSFYLDLLKTPIQDSWREGSLARLGPRDDVDMIVDTFWSPDGKLVAATAEENIFTPETIFVVTSADGELIATLFAPTQFNNVSWSLENSLLAASGADGKIYLWNTETWELIAPISNSGVHISWASFSPDGNYLAWADNASLKIWDTQENRLLHNISIGDVHVDRLSWSPDGFILATIGGRRIEGRSNGVLTEYYVDWDSKIHLWDPVTGEDIRVATGHNGGISQLEWSPNGNHLATTGPDGTIIIWGVSE